MPGGECGGFVLAGGRSSRMGTDKALLNLHGETLLERAAKTVRAAAGEAIVIGSPDRYGRFGFPVIPDVFEGAGPLAGIHSALSYSRWEWNLVAACDMPNLSAVRLRALVEEMRRWPDADAVIPEAGGYTQPLCAMYRRSALPVIEAALREGRLRITDAVRPLLVMHVRESESGVYRNVNTPEEFNALLQ